MVPKFVTVDYVCEVTLQTKFGENLSVGSSVQMGEI